MPTSSAKSATSWDQAKSSSRPTNRVHPLTRKSSNASESHQHKTTPKGITRSASQNTRSTTLGHFSASQLHSIFRCLQATTYSTSYRHPPNLHPSARSHHGYY